MAGLEALPFGEFLGVLQARGFAITLDHHLRLARLLERTGPSLAPVDLKRLLSPIFATNASEQEAFYAACDSYFGTVLAQPATELATMVAAPETPSAGTSQPRRWLTYTIAALLALIAGLAILRPPHPPAEFTPTPKAVLPPGALPTDLPAPTPSAPVVVSPTPAPPPGGQLPTVEPAPPSPSIVPLPESVPLGSRLTDFLTLHRTESQAAVVALVLIGFSLVEWRRWRQRELLIERARNRKPPFSWPVRVRAPKIREFHSQPVYDAARAMRRRQAADTEHLDLLGTLQATIRGGGLPRLVYRRGSRVPEYLVLIDCASPRDHQAAFFDQLAAALEREGVFIARYFYRGDPRICWDERATTSLADLRRLHADHRLLLIGDGAGLLDPLTGEPAPWLPLLTEWREHTLLTPVPSARWGLREETLETLLPVLPATLEAIAEVPDLLERGSVEARLRTWHDDAPTPPRAGRPVSIQALREYLGAPAFEWLCACAIYPELQWNLTLFLAGQFSNAGDLLNETVILRLTRLPWLREGVLPDELRARLLTVLPAERQLRCRRALVALLEANPPPRDSHAADAREIDIAIHRNWIGRHGSGLRTKTPAAAPLPLGEQTRDHSELRLHEPDSKFGLAFLLPRRLRAAIHGQALAPLGIQPILRLVLAILLAWAGCVLIDRAGQPDLAGQTLPAEILDFGKDPLAMVETGAPGTVPLPLKPPPAPTPEAAQSPTPTPQPQPTGTPPSLPFSTRSVSRSSSPYQSSVEFENYARLLREKALEKLQPVVQIPSSNRPLNRSRFPWKNNIVTTVFSVGSAAKGKPKRNASAWDPNWRESFGGVDDPKPDKRGPGYIALAFKPKQNPFYIALPYNDVTRGKTKPEAKTVIPWFRDAFEKEGQSVCRDRWIRIRNRTGKDCYAQWSDCGPFGTDHWQYVFGDERPKPNLNRGAGLEISPAVRDYLGLSDTDVTDWQFVDVKDIPRGPWSMYGENNDFVQMDRALPSRVLSPPTDLRPPRPTEPSVNLGK